jgi:hypothetical protein
MAETPVLANDRDLCKRAPTVLDNPYAKGLETTDPLKVRL